MHHSNLEGAFHLGLKESLYVVVWRWLVSLLVRMLPSRGSAEWRMLCLDLSLFLAGSCCIEMMQMVVFLFAILKLGGHCLSDMGGGAIHLLQLVLDIRRWLYRERSGLGRSLKHAMFGSTRR